MSRVRVGSCEAQADAVWSPAPDGVCDLRSGCVEFACHTIDLAVVVVIRMRRLCAAVGRSATG